MIVLSKDSERRKTRTSGMKPSSRFHSSRVNVVLITLSRYNAIIAGFFTGGSLAVRGGFKAARNSAIGCAVLLAVIEGVGIGIQRMMADNTRLDAPPPPPQQGQLPASAGAIA